MLVTREGHIFTRHSLTYYAPDSQLHGVLARQREMAQIKIETDALRSQPLGREIRAGDGGRRLPRLESSVSRLRYDTGQLQQQHHDAQIQVLKLTQLAERANQRRSQIDGELMEIGHQAVAETSRKRDAETKLTEYQVQIKVLQEQVQREKLASEVSGTVSPRPASTCAERDEGNAGSSVPRKNLSEQNRRDGEFCPYHQWECC